MTSALHSMAVLQVFQAKMLASEEAGLDAASLRDLRSATGLALCATKATPQRCPTAVIADKIKCIHFQKESKCPFLPTICVLPLCSQSLKLNPLHPCTVPPWDLPTILFERFEPLRASEHSR